MQADESVGTFVLTEGMLERANALAGQRRTEPVELAVLAQMAGVLVIVMPVLAVVHDDEGVVEAIAFEFVGVVGAVDDHETRS